MRNGPSRSSEVVDFGTNRKRVCYFLSHLALGGIGANVLFLAKRKSCGVTDGTVGQSVAEVYRLSIVTILLSVTVRPQFAMQILTGVLTPKSPLPVGIGTTV